VKRIPLFIPVPALGRPFGFTNEALGEADYLYARYPEIVQRLKKAPEEIMAADH
tara:strand:- start:635 stop:796 length:162 start_codon:yes stop_codon:yes gene_type:complete